MLSPDDRTLLVDLLTPPEGFTLHHAIATTFTLHLTALLPVPLGFAGADLNSSTDPLGVLQAVRTYADRIDVFCQAGMVSVPEQRNDLLTFLEPIVHQVAAPRPGRLFHPKLWVLRYRNETGDERFRLICGSRNLTHDKAWDAIVSLDGVRTKRRHAVNNPLCKLLISLPARVPTGVAEQRRRSLEDTAEALHYVEWERPDGVLDRPDWLSFHVFGPGRRTAPNFDGYNRLVVSPFMNEDGLETVWPERHCTIVSRAEELDALSDKAKGWLNEHVSGQLWVLDEGAALPDIDSDEAGARWSLTGLHAKVYVVERDNRAHLFIGSANATDAAWGGNDEILVELVGKVGAFGVAATVGHDGSKGADAPGFQRILKPHLLGDPPAVDPDADLQRQLKRALRDFASLPLTGTVDLEGSDSAVGLTITSAQPVPQPPGAATLSVGLLTVPGAEHRPTVGTPLDHRWQLPGVEEITPFVVLRLSAGSPSRPVEASCVTLARLVGDPADRFDRVLARRLGTPEEFLRFLLLLLQLASGGGEFPAGGSGLGSFGATGLGADGSGVLESLVQALATQPESIDDVERLVTQLGATDKGRSVFPAGWDELWGSVLAARKQLRGSK